jgi:hypothetical protein
MGRAKRCRSVVLGTSVAALGAVGGCPAASAANTESVAAHPPVGVVARSHPKRRHHRVVPRPSTHHGPYVYAIHVGGEINVEKADVQCSGSSIKFTRSSLVMPETSAATTLFYRNESSWGKRVTLTAGPATTLTISWTPPAERREAEAEANAHNGEIRNPRLQGQEDTGLASTVCAATAPNAGLGDIGEGEVTWRLPRPVTSLAALLAQPATSVYTNEYMLVFEILPDGSVPSFTAFQALEPAQQ